MPKDLDRSATQQWAIAWPTALKLLHTFAKHHLCRLNKPVPSVHLDFSLRDEPLLRSPANDNDGREQLEPFPEGWWASS